jgi:uncharacterized protein YndB with AHSA1/START domain
MYANYESVDDRPTLRFERRIAHPVAAVWSAIADPAELAHWFPSDVSGEIRADGHLTFTFAVEHDVPPMEGDVTEFDPPHALAFWWGEDHVRFELSPAEEGAQTDLRFTVQLGSVDKAARDSAGWHVCLDRFAAWLDGAGDEALRGVTEGWRRHYEEYERRGFPATAPIPDAMKS